MLKNIRITLGIILMLSTQMQAQNKRIDFPEGLYLSIDAFLAQKPDILFKQLYNKTTGEQPTAFDINSKQTFYVSTTNVPDSLFTNSVFGYATQGLFYLIFNFKKKIYDARSIRAGKVWQFATMVTVNNTVYDPSPFNRMNYQQTVTTQNLMQLILDTETGDVKPLTPENLLEFIADDVEISKEFSSLSKRKQRKEMHAFLSRYNLKHPL